MRSLTYSFLLFVATTTAIAQPGWSWQNPKPQGSDLNAVALLDVNTAVAVGNFHAILRTTDGGANWAPQASGTPFALNAVFFTDANNGWAAGDNGTIRRTTNGGATWTSQTSSTTASLHGISFADPNNGLVVGELGFVAGTMNGGVTWTKQVSRTSNTIRGVSMTDPNTATIVADNGCILRTTSGGITAVEEQIDTTPAGFRLAQNYPNPFNPGTTIRFDLRNHGFVSLKVFDLLGREIATILSGTMEPGGHQAAWNAPGIPSGVYFYRLQAEGMNETRKMILSK